MRAWVYAYGAGLLAVVAIALAAYDRIITWTWGDVIRICPLVLLALAVVNVLRSVMPPGSLIGPTLLGAGAAATFLYRGRPSTWPNSDQIAVAVLSVAALILLHRACEGRGRIWAVFWVSRRRLTIAPNHVVVTSLLGVAAVDFTRLAPAVAGVPTEILCIVLGGRVELTIPDTWRINAATDVVARWIEVSDRGPMPERGAVTAIVTIRLIGVGGGIGLARVGA
jgi:hypothetical protein